MPEPRYRIREDEDFSWLFANDAGHLAYHVKRMQRRGYRYPIVETLANDKTQPVTTEGGKSAIENRCDHNATLKRLFRGRYLCAECFALASWAVEAVATDANGDSEN